MMNTMENHHITGTDDKIINESGHHLPMKTKKEMRFRWKMEKET